MQQRFFSKEKVVQFKPNRKADRQSHRIIAHIIGKMSGYKREHGTGHAAGGAMVSRKGVYHAVKIRFIGNKAPKRRRKQVNRVADKNVFLTKAAGHCLNSALSFCPIR